MPTKKTTKVIRELKNEGAYLPPSHIKIIQDLLALIAQLAPGTAYSAVARAQKYLEDNK